MRKFLEDFTLLMFIALIATWSVIAVGLASMIYIGVMQ